MLDALNARARQLAADLESAPAVEINDPSVVRQLKRVRTAAGELGRMVDDEDKTPVQVPRPRQNL